MPHVMVPCPEEHVAELTAGLLSLQLGMGGWEDESLRDFVSELEPIEARLLDRVASASADHDRLPYRTVAGFLQIEVGELLDLVTTVNDRCRRDGCPLPLVTLIGSSTSESGQPVASPVLEIPHHVAVRILELRESAAQADHDVTSP